MSEFMLTDAQIQNALNGLVEDASETRKIQAVLREFLFRKYGVDILQDPTIDQYHVFTPLGQEDHKAYSYADALAWALKKFEPEIFKTPENPT